MLPFPEKARMRVKIAMEETFLQEEMVIIKGSQGNKTLEEHQRNLLLLGTKLYFLVIAILVQNLGIWQKIVGHITKIIIMFPVNIREAILQEFMNSYS